MKKVFADTGYWVALLNPSDDLNTTSLTGDLRGEGYAISIGRGNHVFRAG